MFVQDNKLSTCKKYFMDRLVKKYDLPEAKSVFSILAQHILTVDKLALMIEPDMRLTEADLLAFNDALKRLLNNIPVQYITGEAPFYDQMFVVTPDVLIPRPETEELVEWIIQETKDHSELRILDIGTGSGCIAITLQKSLPDATVTAIDISETALDVARMNADRLKTKVHFISLDILKEFPEGKFDIIVSNPPYVRQAEKVEIEGKVKWTEPSIALFVSDSDPLIFYRRILELAPSLLNDKGRLYFEINQNLGAPTTQLMIDAGFKEVSLRKDLYGAERMLRGVWRSG